LPLLFILWANLHAGFIAGFGLLGYYAVRRRSFKTGLLLLACFAASFINAYGYRLYEEVGRTLFDPALHWQIAEWNYFRIPGSAQAFLVLWLAGFWLFDKKKLYNWFTLPWLLLLTALSASRNLPLFILSATQPLSKYLTKMVAFIPKHLDWRRKLVLGLLLLGAAYFVLINIQAAIPSPGLSREAAYPQTAIKYLKAHPCDGNLFNSYDYGGYLIWKLPNQPIYIDGRMPTWQVYMNRYENVILKPKQYYKQEFERYHITCALITSYDAQVLSPQLVHDGWKVKLRSGSSILLLAPTSSP
jgi:hypothetical protein